MKNSAENNILPCDQDAAHLAFDLARQLITIAIGCIGFTVGLSYAVPSLLSLTIFWIILGIFGVAIGLGLLFIMNGIGILWQDKSYNIYAPSLRIISALQILAVVMGIGLLCWFLRCPAEMQGNAIQIRIEDGVVLIRPNEQHRQYEVRVEDKTIILSIMD